MSNPAVPAIALFDRPAWRARRARAARAGAVDFLHDEIVARLVDRLDDVDRPFPLALDLGSRSGGLSRALASRRGSDLVVAAEPALAFLTGPAATLPAARIAADPELLPFAAGRFDLAASALVLHWAADLPGALVQLRRALRPDGLFLAALFGGATLIELRTAFVDAELAEEGGASPRVAPTIALAEAASLLQRAGFALPLADTETITVTYPDALALMRDLRGMGETNALHERSRRMLRRGTLARAVALYGERFADAPGRVTATFEVLFLMGWAPAASQPKALRPGSARRRLADALDTVERPAGDPARPRTVDPDRPS